MSLIRDSAFRLSAQAIASSARNRRVEAASLPSRYWNPRETCERLVQAPLSGGTSELHLWRINGALAREVVKCVNRVKPTLAIAHYLSPLPTKSDGCLLDEPDELSHRVPVVKAYGLLANGRAYQLVGPDAPVHGMGQRLLRK